MHPTFGLTLSPWTLTPKSMHIASASTRQVYHVLCINANHKHVTLAFALALISPASSAHESSPQPASYSVDLW